MRHLDSLRTKLRSGRNGFEQTLSDLPAEMRLILQPLYDRRLKRANGHPLLGELAPWFISDLLEVQKEHSIERIAAAWQALYFSVLFLDDVIDGNIPEGESHKVIVATALLQQRGVAQLVAATAKPAAFAKRMTTAFESTALAALQEITEHRNRIVQYSPLAVGRIGNKLHILRVCIDAISEQEDCSLERREWLFAAFDEIVTGLQLLDDVTDWEEDLVAGNMTLPLTLASVRFGAELSPKKGHNDLLAGLIRSGALAKTLTVAVAKLSSAEQLLNKSCNKKSVSLKYVRTMRDNGERLHELVRDAKIKLNAPHFIWHGLSHYRPSKQELELLLRPIKRGFLVVAQSS